MLFSCILSIMARRLVGLLLGFFGMMKDYSLYMGILMYNLVWSWRNGNSQIYTRNLCIAENAMRKGFFVKVLQGKSHIYKN